MKEEIKPVILAIDDDLGTRKSLRMILKPKYDIFTVENIIEATKRIEELTPNVIFLDIRMPNANGLDFLQQIKAANNKIPIVIITAFPSSQTAITALRNGAFDYIVKPFDTHEIFEVVERALSHHNKVAENERLVNNLKKAINKNFFSTTEALLLTIDAKDSYTAGHSKRVSKLFAFVANHLNIHQSQIEVFRYGAFLHDIGKIGVKDDILTKSGRLTDEELCEMRRHPEISYKILEPIKFLKSSLLMVRHHHEWYNGKGYPDGLKGDEIPYTAALLSIVDVYDALTSDRPYRKKLSHEKAIEIIKDGIGTQFVPNLTEKVIAIIDRYFTNSSSEKRVDEDIRERHIFDLN